MMKLKITTLVLMSLCLIPAGAQEQHTADTTVTNHRTAAFDLPWLAKCYGLDWGYYDRISPVQDNTDSLAAAQSAANNLAKAEVERLSAAFRFAVDIAAYYNCSCQTY